MCLSRDSLCVERNEGKACTDELEDYSNTFINKILMSWYILPLNSLLLTGNYVMDIQVKCSFNIHKTVRWGIYNFT